MNSADIYLLGDGDTYFKFDDIISFNVERVSAIHKSINTISFNTNFVSDDNLKALRAAPGILISYDNGETFLYEDKAPATLTGYAITLYFRANSDGKRLLKRIKLNLIQAALNE